ncbi:hypothetical protein M878_45860 (plasmid) [Streptomyces roseochromogenus subsp. oscitans DS 12.976]|uniref:Uncharacterized protein n=1 Tax=Streptomyces roseochromogenus subsp. oscitans DS 12.976 TaxID=1352936 RepID=V6JDL3_STRRC|nr:hypothetical protein M878_45860 [Streptomyces roseochromogenus subsp. oscitans DS 12.976]
MTNLLGPVGVALVYSVRPVHRPVLMARLQDEESRRFAELCRRAS